MGYAYYEIDGMKRGYGVPCKCHKRGCAKRINRGLPYLCYSCTWYFCSKHLTVAGEEEYIKVDCFAGTSPQVCGGCADRLERDERRDKRAVRKVAAAAQDAATVAELAAVHAPEPIPVESTIGFYTVLVGDSGDYLLVVPDA